MDRRRIFTVEPDYFPMTRMREIVDYLHGQDQHFGESPCSLLATYPQLMVLSSTVLMTDPAVGYLPGQNYGPYDRGTAADVWLKNANGSSHLGLVWPGTSCFVRAWTDGSPFL